MNLREFYKTIFTKNTFDSEKIKANAIAGKYVKHRPFFKIIILGLALIFITSSILFFTLLSDKSGKDGLSLVGKPISMLTPQERLERSRILYEQNRDKNTDELTQFLITFNEPMTVSNAKNALVSTDNSVKIDYFYIESSSEGFLISQSDFNEKYDSESVSKIATGTVITTKIKNYNDFQVSEYVYSVEISQSENDIADFKPINSQYNNNDDTMNTPTPTSSSPPVSKTEQSTSEPSSQSSESTTTPPVVTVPKEFAIELESNVSDAYFISENILCVISDKTYLYKNTENNFVKIKEFDDLGNIFILENNMILTYQKAQNTGEFVLNKFNLSNNSESNISGNLPDNSLTVTKVFFNIQTNNLIVKASKLDETAVYSAKINSESSSLEFKTISESDINIIGANENEIFYQKLENEQKSNVIFSFNLSDATITEKLIVEPNISSITSNKHLNFAHILTEEKKYLFISNTAEIIEIPASQNSKISKDGDVAIIGKQVYKLENSKIVKSSVSENEISELLEYNSTTFKIHSIEQNIIKVIEIK